MLNGTFTDDAKRVIDLSVGEDSSYAQQSPVKISPSRDLTKRQVQLAQVDDESSCRDFDAQSSQQQLIDVDMS